MDTNSTDQNQQIEELIHEFGNLTVLMNHYLDMLQESFGSLNLSTEQNQILTTLQKVNARQNALLERERFRVQSEEQKVPKPYSHMAVTPVLREAADSWKKLAEDRNVTLKLSLLDRGLFVKGDSTVLYQVIGNLIKNALEAAESHGISTVNVAAAAFEGKVIIEVADDGKGLDNPDLLGRGQSTKKGHLGTGLAFCQKEVQGMQGQFSYARDGGRSVFRIDLPQSRDKRTYLVVEDDADILDVLVQAIEKQGDIGWGFETGEQASKVDMQRVDGAIIDLRLPGQSGLETWKALCKPGHTPTVFYTGYREMAEDVEQTAPGVPMYLKPTNHKRLLQALSESIETS